MIIILMTPDGKKVRVNPAKDECLSRADYTIGVDIYAHKARSGRLYFYRYGWTMQIPGLSLRQGDIDKCEFISEEEARDYLERQKDPMFALDEEEIEKIEKYFPGLFDEDA